jgi:hypothetical protein
VVLGPVDEGDGDRGPAQRSGGEQPCETAAYDHDPAWAGLVSHNLYLLIRSHAAAAIPHGACSPRVPEVHELPDRLVREFLDERPHTEVLHPALAAEAQWSLCIRPVRI